MDTINNGTAGMEQSTGWMFGHNFLPIQDGSTVLSTIDDVAAPVKCHHLCTDMEECQGWVLSYVEILNYRELPTCDLFSSVKWEAIPTGMGINTVVGSATELPFQIPEDSDCDAMVCEDIENYLPLFVGPYGGTRYVPSCTSDNPACLLFPTDLKTSASMKNIGEMGMTEMRAMAEGLQVPTCCTLCGLPGYLPCDQNISSLRNNSHHPWGKTNMPSMSMMPRPDPMMWGCWSAGYEFADEGTTMLDETSTPDTRSCKKMCHSTMECVAWQFEAVPTVPGLQRCMTYSSIGEIFVKVLFDGEVASAIGLRDCFSPLISKDLADAFYMGLSDAFPSDFDTISSDLMEILADSVPMDDGEPRIIRLDFVSLMEAFVPFSMHADAAGRDLSLITMFSQSTTIPTNESVSSTDGLGDTMLFMIPKQLPADLLESVWSVMTDEQQMAIQMAAQMPDESNISPLGLSINCSGGILNNACVLECVDNVTGIIPMRLSYAFNVMGTVIDGPGLVTLAVIDGVCSDLMEKYKSTTEEPTTMAPGMVSTKDGDMMSSVQTLDGQQIIGEVCNKFGHIGVFGTPMLNSFEAVDSDECIDACDNDEQCSHYQYFGHRCQLMQNGTVFDTFFRDEVDSCSDCCANDSECHSSTLLVPMCYHYAEEPSEVIPSGQGYTAMTGPVGCLRAHRNKIVDVPPMSTTAPNLVTNIDEDGVNGITIDDFVPEEHSGALLCADGWSGIDGRCMMVLPHRLSLRDAERTCSDLSSVLFRPTADALSELCEEGLVDCSTIGRQSQYWTRLTLDSSEPQAMDGGFSLGDDFSVSVSTSGPENEMGPCLLIDFFSGNLQSTTCGAYCVTPGTPLSMASGALDCGDGGSFALRRRPFICEAISTLPKPEQIESPSRVASYVDDAGIRRCALMHADIPGNDMWNTQYWAEPLNSWDQCEGMCRDVDGCQGYVYTEGYCEMNKEEADKGWNASLVFTLPVAPAGGLMGQALCDHLCMSDKECNSGAIYQPGVCFVKSANGPMQDQSFWLNGYSGPVDCDAEIDPVVPSTEECPVDFRLITSGNGNALCVYVSTERTSAPEAHRKCLARGGILASLKSEEENDMLLMAFCPTNDQESCLIPRGDGALDGVFFMGIGSDAPNLNDNWHWVDGSTLTYPAHFGGQGDYPQLMFGDWPTIQPDNTSGNQLCAYFYPRDSNSGEPNGHWGDEDCDTKCLQPGSPNLAMSHAPPCNNGAGRITQLGRKFVCTAEPSK